MTHYDCLAIYVTSGGYGLEISCTDEKTLNWIGDQIQQERPACDITNKTQLSCLFRIIGYQPPEIGWWIVQQLCHRGWEPFGNVRWEDSWGLEFITLRKANSREQS